MPKLETTLFIAAVAMVVLVVGELVLLPRPSQASANRQWHVQCGRDLVFDGRGRAVVNPAFQLGNRVLLDSMQRMVAFFPDTCVAKVVGP